MSSINLDVILADYDYIIYLDEEYKIKKTSATVLKEFGNFVGKPVTDLLELDSASKMFFPKDQLKHISPFHTTISKEKNRAILDGVLINVGEELIFASELINEKEAFNAEESFAYEKYLFQAFMDNFPASLYFKDRKSRFFKISKLMAENIGLSDPDEAIGKSDADFFSPELAERARLDEEQIIATGNGIRNKVEKEEWPDGSITWVTTTKLPLYGHNNKIIGTFGFTYDITAQKRTEEELNYERFLFNTLMDNVSDSIYFKDKDSKFLRTSKSMCKKFGFDNCETLIGISDFDVFTEEHALEAYNNEQEIIKTRKPILNQFEKETWEDGHVSWVLSNKLPLINEKGDVIGTFGISRDVTELKQKELIQQALYKLSEAAITVENMDVLFEVIFNIVNELFPTPNFYIAEYDDESNELSFPFWVDEYDDCPDSRQLGNSLTDTVIKNGEPFLLSQNEYNEFYKELGISIQGKIPYYWLGIPLKVQNKVFGVIAIQSYDPKRIVDATHKNLLTFISNQIAIVIDRVKTKQKNKLIAKEREMLAESLKKSNDIINNSQAVVFRWNNDSAWTVEFVSKNVEWILGYKVSEFLSGKIKYSEIIFKEDLNQFTEELTTAMFDDTLKYCNHENYRIVCKSGKIIWVENKTYIIRDSSGNISHYEAILLDVTIRKTNEIKANYRSNFEKRISQISTHFVENELANIKDALSFAAQHIGTFLNADRYFVALSGGTDKFYVSYQLEHELLPSVTGDDDELLLFPNETAFNKIKEGSVSLELSIDESNQQKDNALIKSSITVPIFANRTLHGFLQFDFLETPSELNYEDMHLFELFAEIVSNVYKNYLGDIEKRKLQIKMEKMTQAVEQSANSIVITDIDGDIEYVNPKFEQVTGYSFEEVKGKNPKILKSGTTTDDQYKELWKTLIRGETWSGEFKNIKKNGEIFWERATISPIKNEDGLITNFIAVKEDITERIMVENQLALSQKMESIGQLAAGIAHEINTPMQYVGDNAQFLHDSYDAMFKVFYDFNAFLEDGNDYTNSEIREFYREKKEEMDLEFIFEEVPEALEQTHTGINRVTQIVKAMKNFAHPGTKEKTMHDINQGIINTATISRNEYKYVAELEVDLDEELKEVKCLMDELNQVFLNMIVNAAHAIAEKQQKSGDSTPGSIKISTRKEGDKAVIRISDSGAGIKKENVNRIFDPFFTTKEVGKGTGQGLAIAHDIIANKHNGKIEVESEIGVGTTFIMTIPINDTDGE